MDHYTSFISLIKEFLDLFQSFTVVEQQKLDAAVANDLSLLEDCMKKEQAFVLRLKGLEQQRDTLQAKMDMKDLSFREILSEVPPETERELSPLFQELSEKVRTFQSIHASAQDAIRVNLHKIQSILNHGQPESAVYSSSGSNRPEETHFTNRFV